MTRGHKVCSIKMQSPRHVGVAKCSKSSKQTLARRVHKLPSRKEIVVSSPSHISNSPQPGPSWPGLDLHSRELHGENVRGKNCIVCGTHKTFHLLHSLFRQLHVAPAHLQQLHSQSHSQWHSHSLGICKSA